MRVLTIGDRSISFYQSIRELPISLYSEFQKYLMQEGGLGSDINSIGSHYDKLLTFYQQRNDEAFNQEYQNLQYNLIHILEGITIDHYAFACLVQAIDKERIIDYSESGLKIIIDQLNRIGFTQDQAEEILAEVKKNWIAN